MTKPVEREAGRVPPFDSSETYERLLALRESDPRAFLLRTSPATRLALEHYEHWRAAAGPERGA